MNPDYILKDIIDEFRENIGLAVIIYVLIFIISGVSIMQEDYDFLDKIIDISFIMFAIFIAATSISTKKAKQKKMLNLAQLYLLTGLMTFVSTHMIKLGGGIKMENLFAICLLMSSIIFFSWCLGHTFKIINHIDK